MSAWPGIFVIGLSGEVGSGKREVRRLLEELGAFVIDADALYYRAVLPDAPGYQPILDALGPTVLNILGEIDRKKLGERIASDPAALSHLKAILHPLVRQQVDTLVRARKGGVVVIEAAKLLDSPFRQSCDAVWLVTNEKGPLTSEAGITAIENTGLPQDLAEKTKAAWKLVRGPAALAGRSRRPDSRLAALLRLWGEGLRRFLRHPMAKVGVGILVLFAILMVLHPLLLGTVWPRGVYNPLLGYDLNAAPWPSGPSWSHLLGVDAQGRDIFSMLLAAIPPSFEVALAAALATLVLSTAIGALSAYYRGALDAILYNLSSALYLVPALVIVAILAARYYEEIGSWEFGLIYGALVGGGSAAIVMRSHGISLMTRPYIDASRVAGAGAGRIIFRHLIPHLLPLAVVQMMLAVVGAVVADGFMAFFGFGDTRFNLGFMVYNGIFYLNINPSIPWLQIIAPTFALSLFVAAFYLIARALQDLSDPRLAESRRIK
ncbi:MAG: dephospho-CoA kinase [Anaerolineales bacterium]